MNGAWNLTASDVITGLLVVGVGLLTFFGKRYVDKVDSLDAEAVRKHDLKELEERMEASRLFMHTENQRALLDIKDSVKETRTSLNELVRSLLNRGPGR